VKIDAILNAAGAFIPVKVAKTVELQRVSGSAGPLAPAIGRWLKGYA